MCFVWLSEETVTFAVHIINRLVFITKVEGVYCAVRTESLYDTDRFRFQRVKEVAEASRMHCYSLTHCVRRQHSGMP